MAQPHAFYLGFKMDRIEIGIVSKPQGIKGELKIKSLTDENSRFTKLKKVYIGNEEKKVLAVRVNGSEVFMAIEGIADRNAAELYRGRSVSVDRENAVQPQKGSYFIVDVIGCKVVGKSGRVYGAIRDVLQYGAADVFELDCGTMFPFLERVVESVDVERKQITVFEDKFDEVALYED